MQQCNMPLGAIRCLDRTWPYQYVHSVWEVARTTRFMTSSEQPNKQALTPLNVSKIVSFYRRTALIDFPSFGSILSRLLAMGENSRTRRLCCRGPSVFTSGQEAQIAMSRYGLEDFLDAAHHEL